MIRFARVQPWLSLMVRLALAGILLWAGLAKLVEPLVALQAVAAYELLPQALIPIVGYGLPLLEVAMGLLLLLGLLTRWVAVGTAVLMAVFIAGVASAWARGLTIDCGCFGGGGQVAPGETQYLAEILRDLGFIALAAWLVVFPRSRFGLDARYAELDDDE
ncbi:MauE/DoxX family redox-associated membrane protein [Microlunatus sp. Y2014]|uniref:MauE/DoxX family redox-associated membrane protein n=1 Tax=Microlunatus sp. Y2014 TaxID=3418488 RepID=UPI003DA70CFF